MPAVEIAPGVHRLPLVPGDLLNAFALTSEDGLTLVDAGLRWWTRRRLRAGLASLGRSVHDVRRVVVTHAHADHAGGVAAVVAEAGAQVEAHEREAVYLRDGRPPAHPARGRLGGFPPAGPARTFADGELLDVAGGLRVLHTPGHTPGHVSLLHEPTGTLLTGDALLNLRRVRYPFGAFCTDRALAARGAQRLGDLDFDVVGFAHGPEIRAGARAAVRAFLRGRTR